MFPDATRCCIFSCCQLVRFASPKNHQVWCTPISEQQMMICPEVAKLTLLKYMGSESMA